MLSTHCMANSKKFTKNRFKWKSLNYLIKELTHDRVDLSAVDSTLCMRLNWLLRTIYAEFRTTIPVITLKNKQKMTF